MKNKSLLTLIITVFNRIMVAGYHAIQRKRNRPYSVIDLVTYSGNREAFGLEHVAPWHAKIALDKRIEGMIEQYGITHYQTINLYKLPSHMLDDALVLIPLGIVKPDDFKTDKPIARIFRKDEFLLSKGNTKFLDRWLDDNDVRNAARRLATTEKEYNDIRFNIARYKASIDINRYFTKEIEDCREAFGISTYLSQSLYDVTEEVLFYEARDAVGVMWYLSDRKCVVSYDGQSVFNLTKFLLNKARAQVDAGDYTGIVFDEQRKEKQEAYYLQSKKEEERKDKRNAAARERRAKLKAEKEEPSKLITVNYSKKAHHEKLLKRIAGSEKANMPVKKTAKSSPSQPSGKTAVAPVKKMHLKKAVKKKAS